MHSKALAWLFGAGVVTIAIAGYANWHRIDQWYGRYGGFNTNPTAVTSYYPATVPAGPPAPARKLDIYSNPPTSATKLSIDSNPPPAVPTGGLAGVQGRAARWALGRSGAIVVFINPGDAAVPWEIRYVWIPEAKKYHLTVDLVDIQAVVRPAPLGSGGPAYDKPPTHPTQTVAVKDVEPALPAQSLAQMATTMQAAAKAWHLPSWIQLYEISPQTAADWHATPLYLGSTRQESFWWLLLQPLAGGSGLPLLGGPYNAHMSFAQAQASMKTTFVPPAP